MLPLVIIGTTTGVLVNLMFPPIVLSICLSALLLFLTYGSTKNAIKLYKKETLLMKQKIEMPIEKIDRAKLDKEKFIPDIRAINLEPEGA